jgi:predicted Rossmann fold nucleotide-binding protein DprA/Smf involved in DNA uptake
MQKAIGIVGNRYEWGLLEVLEKIHQTGIVTKDDVIVSGGAVGVDTFAQIYAKKNGIPILICYPDPKKASPQRFYERNGEIARISDIIIAFNIKNERSGTYNTITQARKLGKKIILFDKGNGFCKMQKINFEEDKEKK